MSLKQTPPNEARYANQVLALPARSPRSLCQGGYSSGGGYGELAHYLPCDSAVVIQASSTSKGIEMERRWLRENYPGHGGYGQSLRGDDSGKRFDVFEFKTRDGRNASVCFDITSFFGKW